MAHEYKFSLLLASQYSGGPVEWNESSLITGTGAVLNYVDLTADSSRATRPATTDIVSVSISVKMACEDPIKRYLFSHAENSSSSSKMACICLSPLLSQDGCSAGHRFTQNPLERQSLSLGLLVVLK